MIRANFISQKGAWQATPADTIVLDYEGRHRRRVTMTGTRGVEFLLDLPEAVALRGGDALILEDGRLVEIIAAPEELAEVRCADPRQLARVAYHIGNRHVQAEILANRIRIRRDHVLEDMVRGLGAKVAHIEAPFEPDTGAYEPQDAHAHSHAAHAHKGHDHKHDDHGHDHGHAAPAHGEKGHVHDEHCGHDHAHDHKAHDHKHESHDHAHKDAHGHSHGAHAHKHD
ncbi:MAG: urease accessory protein UreE [Beijerinckiaceae bacterium]|nr:urease accessory protein UreE [Beijerinckiaceae bacterium]